MDEAPTQGIGTMADAPRVFLSYSHDSGEHAARVLALADTLRHGELDVILDQYVHPAPAEGWPHWMERNLKAADFVLLVCTATYCRRVRAEETPGQGTGVRWEGRIVYNHLCYGDDPTGTRFIPVLLPGAEPTHIPDPVRGHNHYQITAFDLSDAGYEGLYRHLTGQAPTPQREHGTIETLPPRPRWVPPDPRLMSSLNDVSGIPTEGKNLIILADVKNVLHFRIFDGDGKMVVDTDEKKLTERARRIEDLREQLESLWPPHELTRSDKDRIGVTDE